MPDASLTAMPPTVSIIIPTYNRPHWLGQAIESALGQTYPSTEIIVVDDGSANNAAGVIAAGYPNVRYEYQANKGLGAARNAGIRHSSGEFLAFLDDDDWLTPDSVAVRMAALEAVPEAGFVYSDLYLADAAGSVLGRYYAGAATLPPSGDVYRRLIKQNYIPVHSVLWRRRVMEDAGCFPIIGLGTEDWYVLVRAAEFATAIYLDCPVGFYRLHAHNMTLDYAGHVAAAAFTQQYIASDRFASLASSEQVRVLLRFAGQHWLYGDLALAHNLLSKARTIDRFSPLPLILRSGMLLGRPFGRWLLGRLRWARQLSRRPSATQYFLQRAKR